MPLLVAAGEAKKPRRGENRLEQPAEVVWLRRRETINDPVPVQAAEPPSGREFSRCASARTRTGSDARLISSRREIERVRPVLVMVDHRGRMRNEGTRANREDQVGDKDGDDDDDDQNDHRTLS